MVDRGRIELPTPGFSAPAPGGDSRSPSVGIRVNPASWAPPRRGDPADISRSRPHVPPKSRPSFGATPGMINPGRAPNPATIQARNDDLGATWAERGASNCERRTTAEPQALGAEAVRSAAHPSTARQPRPDAAPTRPGPTRAPVHQSLLGRRCEDAYTPTALDQMAENEEGVHPTAVINRMPILVVRRCSAATSPGCRLCQLRGH